MTIRLNDKSQSYSIPDIVTSGAPIVWVLVALTILVTACAVIVTVRRIDVPSWARAVGMSVVGVSTILGFLLYAGSDSGGCRDAYLDARIDGGDRRRHLFSVRCRVSSLSGSALSYRD